MEKGVFDKIIVFLGHCLATAFVPIAKNLPFMVFMYILCMVAAACTVVVSSDKTLYENAWTETFLNVYAVCVLLTLLPERVGKWKASPRAIVRGLIYAVAYPLAVIDVYCYVKFDAPINPSILMLAGETDTREAGEFLQMYLSPDLLLTNVGLVLLVPLVHIIYTIAVKYLKGRVNVHTPSLRIRSVLGLCTVSLAVYSGVVCSDNYYQVCSLMSQESIGDVEHKLTEKDKAEQYFFAYRTAFSIYANHLAAKQIDVIHRVMADVRVDSCSVTSPNIVLIIGEAYNKYHSQLYGYDKPTTPKQLALREEGALISFDDVVAPWNLTSYVFKHIMSTYVVGDKGDWCDYPLFGKVFREAGYHVSFLTNEFLPQAKQAVYDFSGGFFLNDKALSDAQFDTRNTQLHVFDESLLADYDALKHDIYGGYADSIDNDPKPHLTIFHLIGQHVNYRIRCPNRKKVFKAEDYADRTDLTEKWKKNLSDYDNATMYNDSIVSEIVRRFDGTNTIVIYMPDHGEEVHSRELPHYFGRMHSTKITKRLAREEFGIPFWIYATPKYRQQHPEIWDAVKSAHSRKYMTDALPHLLMYLAGIHCPYYREELNILSSKYNENRPRILKHQTDYDEVAN